MSLFQADAWLGVSVCIMFVRVGTMTCSFLVESSVYFTFSHYGWARFCCFESG